MLQANGKWIGRLPEIDGLIKTRGRKLTETVKCGSKDINGDLQQVKWPEGSQQVSFPSSHCSALLEESFKKAFLLNVAAGNGKTHSSFLLSYKLSYKKTRIRVNF